MVKGTSKHELIILLAKGLKPKEISKILPLYNKKTIYYYSVRYKRALEILVRMNIVDMDGRLKVKV